MTKKSKQQLETLFSKKVAKDMITLSESFKKCTMQKYQIGVSDYKSLEKSIFKRLGEEFLPIWNNIVLEET